MEQPGTSYDEVGDTLYVSYKPDREATGVELNDHILLRIDERSRELVGVTIFNYSVVVQRTEMGPRSFPLVGLQKLPEDLQEITLEILSQPPANEIFSLSAYTPSSTHESLPITSVQTVPIAVGG
ncbi:MAG: DUF2283 domain-containing protein [Gammaproteobacteria bacterium]|nr:DUF2283 domain-containing protein [Gammaproteobacteria bacterium]